MTAYGVVLILLRHAVFNADCIADSAVVHSFRGLPRSTIVVLAVRTTSRMMRYTVPFVHAESATVDCFYTPQAAATLCETRFLK